MRLACFLVCFVCTFTPSAHAGWVMEWQNTARRADGEAKEPENSTMFLAGNKVRLTQPRVTTLIDYKSGTFTLMNPKRELFWSGSVEDYVTEMSTAREKALREKSSNENFKFNVPKLDPKSFPAIAITKTDATKTIAGHSATKYSIESDGVLFQEDWIAEDLNTSADLDPSKFLDYQAKVSAGMLGKSSGAFNALYRNQEYRKLLEKGVVLQTTTYHSSGSFERLVNSVRAAEVTAGEFEIPPSFRRVKLHDVMDDPSGKSAAGK